MNTINPNWTAAWVATSINSTSIADGATSTSGAITNDGKSATEVSVVIAYGGTVDEGAKVYLLRDIDGTNFETVDDAPWSFEMPSAVSDTRNRVFTVDGTQIGKFKIEVTNDSGASITATVRTRQATIDAV